VSFGWIRPALGGIRPSVNQKKIFRVFARVAVVASIKVNKMLMHRGISVINAAMLEPGSHSARRPAIVSIEDELVHFELCPMCSQAVDRRDIFAVMHHLPVGHRPQPRH